MDYQDCSQGAKFLLYFLSEVWKLDSALDIQMRSSTYIVPSVFHAYVKLKSKFISFSKIGHQFNLLFFILLPVKIYFRSEMPDERPDLEAPVLKLWCLPYTIHTWSYIIRKFFMIFHKAISWGLLYMILTSLMMEVCWCSFSALSYNATLFYCNLIQFYFGVLFYIFYHWISIGGNSWPMNPCTGIQKSLIALNYKIVSRISDLCQDTNLTDIFLLCCECCVSIQKA